MIRVAVSGAAGRMGETVCRAVEDAEDMELVGRADPLLNATLEEILPEAEVIVDFSRPDTALGNALSCLRAGVHVVVGTSGFDPAPLRQARPPEGRPAANALVVPNFAIGAVLMMRFAEIAAKWLPDAEVIEFHHDRKEDAPSGTAMLTAEKIGNARANAPTSLPKPLIKAEGARGGLVNGVPVHSVRLPGLLAHQEVIFGGPGEILTLRHDSLDRASFMQGVKLCAKTVRSLTGLTVGLDKILF